jgi:hypothetical protein
MYVMDFLSVVDVAIAKASNRAQRCFTTPTLGRVDSVLFCLFGGMALLILHFLSKQSMLILLISHSTDIDLGALQ